MTPAPDPAPRPSDSARFLERPFWDHVGARPFDDIDQVLEEIHETAAEAFAARQDALDTEAADWLRILETEREAGA